LVMEAIDGIFEAQWLDDASRSALSSSRCARKFASSRFSSRSRWSSGSAEPRPPARACGRSCAAGPKRPPIIY
jgi:hypothetical protein